MNSLFRSDFPLFVIDHLLLHVLDLLGDSCMTEDVLKLSYDQDHAVQILKRCARAAVHFELDVGSQYSVLPSIPRGTRARSHRRKLRQTGRLVWVHVNKREKRHTTPIPKRLQSQPHHHPHQYRQRPTNHLSSANTAAPGPHPDLRPSEFFCPGEPLLEEAVFSDFVVLLGVVMDDKEGFDLDGVVVDDCSGVAVIIALLLLRVNFGGVVIEEFKGRSLDLACGLGLVRLIEGEEDDRRDEFEGDREGVSAGAVLLEGGVMAMGVDATRVLSC
ncbi:hypothetical protein BYT27DRAFT_7216149 [Phlegmacium glaucopus]|nr:hypothetical protein BYT27DRAFT_7216149 [Phlegmacium glaucopus]